MFGVGKVSETLSILTNKVAELYKEIVTTNVNLDEVRRYTVVEIEEFKRLIKRQSDKIDRIERERIKAEAELLAKIKGLEARIAALSERPLHAAAADAVAEFARLRDNRISPLPSENDDEPS